tara:strand:+ start:8951 stop:9280 length:330 start_codon:yes stop_codon:yes gene_type:complete
MKPICRTNRHGDKCWWLNDKLHREDGPAVEKANGDKEWWINGNLHREDGPAIKNYNGDEYWCINGLLHREDGPACEWANGSKFWYYQDKAIFCKNNKEFLRMIKLLVFL